MALEEVGLGLILEFKAAGLAVFQQVSDMLGGIKGKVGEAESAVAKMGASFQTAGLVSAAALGATAVAAGVVAAKSISMAGDFQNALIHLTTDAGESAANIGLVQKGLLDLSRTVGVSATELTNAMYYVESAGYHGAAGLQVLKVAEEGARVGGAEAVTMADAVTSALNAYSLPATQATAVTNNLIAAVAQGKTRLQDVAGALGMVLPSAAALKIPLEQVSAGLATMTAQGTPAADAATYMRYTLASLANPTSQARQELQNLGLTQASVAEMMTSKGLPAALQFLTDAIGRKFPEGSAQYIAALSNIVGGTRGMQATLELTGKHLATYQDNVAAVSEAVARGGDAVDNWSQIQDTFNFQLDRFHSLVSSLFIELGLKLLPAATYTLEAFMRFLGFLGDHSGVLIAVGAAVGLVATALASLAVPAIVGALTPLFGAMAGLALPFAAAAAAVVGLVIAFEHFRPVLNDVLQAFRVGFAGGTFSGQFSAIERAAYAAGVALRTSIIPALVEFGHAALDWVTNRAIPAVDQFGRSVMQWIGANAIPILTGLGTTAVAVFRSITGWVRDELVPAIVHLGAIVGPIFQAVGNAVGADVGRAVATLRDFAGLVLPEVARVVEIWAPRVVHLFEGLGTGLLAVLNTIADFVKRHASTVTNLISTLWVTVRGTIEIAWAAISGIIKVGLDLLQGNWSRAWTDMKDSLAGIWQGIKDVVGAQLKGIEDLISLAGNAFFDLGKQLFEHLLGGIVAAAHAIGGPVGGALKTVLGGLPGFAGGVTNFAGGLAVVGENGPELVSLPAGSSVYPHGTGPAAGGGSTITVNLVGMQTTYEQAREISKVLKDELLSVIQVRP